MPTLQWGIYDLPYPSEEQPHPCVLISNQGIIDNPAYAFVNALLCVSLRADMQLKAFHVRLNGADGLDNATVVKCNEIYRFEKAAIGSRRGTVSYQRKKAIDRKLIDIFGLPTA